MKYELLHIPTASHWAWSECDVNQALLSHNEIFTILFLYGYYIHTHFNGLFSFERYNNEYEDKPLQVIAHEFEIVGVEDEI